MAYKETQEALNYMFGCAMTKDDITDYEEKRMIECSDIIKKAIDRNEVLEKALNEASEIVSRDSSRDERSFHCIPVEDARDYFLQKAKEELESEKENGK